MKKIIISSISIVFALFLANSCKKGNISGDASNLKLGAYITLDSVINENLNFSDPSATVSISINGKGSPIASVNIYVATGASALDTTTWVLIKNVPFTNGVVLSVSTGELSAALAKVNSSIQPGTQYALQNEVVTTDGRYFSVANTPSNFSGQLGYNMALTWPATAVCQFVAADAAGTYSVVTDTWVDYNLGTLIQITAGPGTNEITMPIYPGPLGPPVDAVPVVVDVNPSTDVATISSQVTGYYGSASPGNKVTLTGTGYVFSCAGYITLSMTINVGGSVYPGYTFTVKKQ